MYSYVELLLEIVSFVTFSWLYFYNILDFEYSVECSQMPLQIQGFCSLKSCFYFYAVLWSCNYDGKWNGFYFKLWAEAQWEWYYCTWSKLVLWHCLVVRHRVYWQILQGEACCPVHLSFLYPNSLVTDNLHLWRAHCNGEGRINYCFICIGWHRWVPSHCTQILDKHCEGVWAPKHRHIGWNHRIQLRWSEAELAYSNVQSVTNHMPLWD